MSIRRMPWRIFAAKVQVSAESVQGPFMPSRAVSAAIAVILAAGPLQAARAATTTIKPISKTEKKIENVGTVIAYALPVFAGGVAVYHGDWNGIGELGGETFLTVGTAWALKQFVREQRPDDSNFHSFPSGTTAIAASGSSFLWGRYGWEWGLPAFAATEFVSYSRVQAKQHHWYDTIASSAIAIGYSTIVVRRYHSNNFTTSLDASPDGAYLRLAWQF
jgi:membrane-associated phospholipid phosphatase